MTYASTKKKQSEISSRNESSFSKYHSKPSRQMLLLKATGQINGRNNKGVYYPMV